MKNAKITSFPIWEKVYSEIKKISDLEYFENIKIVHVNYY